MVCGGSEAACYQWVMVWFIDAIQPPCATAHWHGGGWVVGRPPAVGLPSCLHAATGMEEVGWWGDPHEGFILSKPYMMWKYTSEMSDLSGIVEASVLVDCFT